MRLRPSAKDLTTVGCTIIGSPLCVINISAFINAGGLFPGGFTGLTVFIQRCAEKYINLQVPYSAVNFASSTIPAYIGYKAVGKKSALYSCMMIVLTGVFVEILPVISITEDVLLATISGGILQSVALGIALHGGAGSGGTNFIAMWISQRINQPTWNYILAMNAIILMAAGYLFGRNVALYFMVSQFCSTQVINFVCTCYKRMTLSIVTNNPDIMIEEIQNSAHYGVTWLEGIGTYYGRSRTMLYTVVDSQSVKGLVTRTRGIDQISSVNVTKTEGAEKKFYQRPIE